MLDPQMNHSKKSSGVNSKPSDGYVAGVKAFGKESVTST